MAIEEEPGSYEKTMHNCLILLRNLLVQDEVPESVSEYLEKVNDLMMEMFQAPRQDEIS
jgi:hypothetical protein